MLATFRTLTSALELREFSSKELAEHSGVAEDTVRKIVQRNQEFWPPGPLQSTGRPGRPPCRYRLSANGRRRLSARLSQLGERVEQLTAPLPELDGQGGIPDLVIAAEEALLSSAKEGEVARREAITLGWLGRDRAAALAESAESAQRKRFEAHLEVLEILLGTCELEERLAEADLPDEGGARWHTQAVQLAERLRALTTRSRALDDGALQEGVQRRFAVTIGSRVGDTEAPPMEVGVLDLAADSATASRPTKLFQSALDSLRSTTGVQIRFEVRTIAPTEAAITDVEFSIALVILPRTQRAAADALERWHGATVELGGASNERGLLLSRILSSPIAERYVVIDPRAEEGHLALGVGQRGVYLHEGEASVERLARIVADDLA